jgi:hypothetical protein
MSDLAQVSVPQPYIDHLNRSAETFLRLWERSESLAVVPVANLARQAVASASSTYCSGSWPGEHCYSPLRTNDGSHSTALGGYESWANDGIAPLPQWVELTWNTPISASRVDLYTTTGYPLQAYDIEYWNDASASWVPIAIENSNTSTFRSYTATFTTRRLRVLARLGPAVQAGYVRINEIEVY